MRRLVIIEMMSIDGFYTGTGNDVSVMPYDSAFEAYNIERISAADTVLLGRTSYDEFAGFWPPLAGDPEASPGAREFARIYNGLEKVVVAHHKTPADLTGIWKDSTRIINDDAHRHVAELLSGAGKDVVMWASRTLWIDLVRHGIDAELHLVVGNGLVGAGVPMFGGADGIELTGLGAPRRLPESESILLTYAVTAGGTPRSAG